MSALPRIALVVGSTRPTRFADRPAQWMLRQMQARDDMTAEVVDLRDHPLPFFDERASNLWAPSEGAEARRWQQTIARFDGFVFTVAEYNRSIPAALKNALDHAYREWNRKPMTAIAYGATGGARALEHLRLIAIELQMVPTRAAVHVGGADFFAVHPMGGGRPFEEVEASLLPGARAALDELVWWARLTRPARQAAQDKAA